ncbi:unnamed protein product [Lathyrus sativus]|nr:unnamed protein product [Lathyrus sativus]
MTIEFGSLLLRISWIAETYWIDNEDEERMRS